MRAVGYLICIVCVAAPCIAQPPPVNVRIFPSSVTQTEPVVSVHPENPNILFASAVTLNTNGGFTSEGVYITTNGGQSWFGSDTCRGALIQNHGRDPWVGISPSGRLIITHQSPVYPGVFSHYSDDLGATWSNAYVITSQQTDDKGTSSIDNTPTSPYYGRMYSTWANIATLPPILVSYSTNGAQTWSAPAPINPSPPLTCIGGYVRTGADGKVYVCWAGRLISTPFNEDFAGFAISSNGGASWRTTQNAFDMNGIFGTLPAKSNIRVNGLPHLDIDKTTGPRRGWIYVVTTEKNLAPAGTDPDVVFHRSTDDGLTWSAGIRVNQYALNNGKTQYFPALSVDQSGGVNIIYYDDRNTSTDSSEVVLARSMDGGTTWTERVISDHRFKPKPIIGGASNYQGDHISLLAVGTKLFAFWMDDFSGLYQVWLAIISLTSDVVDEDPSSHPLEFKLLQNYPNPFNPSTTIQFIIPVRTYGCTSLRIYDVLGREVTTLVNEVKQPGTYSVQYDASGLASGAYFYRLRSGDFVSTRKLFLLK
jgi:hypothetical protein